MFNVTPYPEERSRRLMSSQASLSSDLSASRWRTNVFPPDSEQTACLLKCQINLSSDQVENN